MVLLLVGLGFKIAAVPFHMWTPDVYEGAPSPVTGFMASATKAAGFAALLRVLFTGLAQYQTDWRNLLFALAVLTLLGGSIAALRQTDLKRLLAYSSIAHAGLRPHRRPGRAPRAACSRRSSTCSCTRS